MNATTSGKNVFSSKTRQQVGKYSTTHLRVLNKVHYRLHNLKARKIWSRQNSSWRCNCKQSFLVILKHTMWFSSGFVILKISDISFKPTNKNKTPRAIFACTCCRTHHMFNTFWQLYRKRVRGKKRIRRNTEEEFYIFYT